MHKTDYCTLIFFVRSYLAAKMTNAISQRSSGDEIGNGQVISMKEIFIRYLNSSIKRTICFLVNHIFFRICRGRVENNSIEWRCIGW